MPAVLGFECRSGICVRLKFIGRNF